MDNSSALYRVIASQLSCWRFFLLLALPPLVIALLCPLPWLATGICCLLMFEGYYCWRMFLDERLFLLLAEGTDIQVIDQGVALMWNKSTRPEREWDSRWQGTSKMIRRGACVLLGAWLISLMAIWFGGSSLGNSGAGSFVSVDWVNTPGVTP